MTSGWQPARGVPDRDAGRTKRAGRRRLPPGPPRPASARAAIPVAAGGGAEVGNARDCERSEELIERPRRVQVGGLPLERRSDAVGAEVMDVEQEGVRVDCFDAERLARLGRKVGEVERHDEF